MRYLIKSVYTFFGIQIRRWRFLCHLNGMMYFVVYSNAITMKSYQYQGQLTFALFFYAFLFGQTKRDTILFFSRRDRRTNPMIAFANIAIILSSRIKKWVFCASLRYVQLHISLLRSLLAITFFNL